MQESLDTAKSLLKAGFASAAYVWAVRAVEMFFKEFLLAPHFYDQAEANWWKALNLAEREFGSSRWTRAMNKIEEVFGPIAPMLTDDDEDAFQVWRTYIVRTRGDIVHGKMDATQRQAELVIGWSEQLVLQMKLRVIVARKHPLSKFFVRALEDFREKMQAADDAESTPEGKKDQSGDSAPGSPAN